LEYLKGSCLRSLHILSEDITERGLESLSLLTLERLTLGGGLHLETSWHWIQKLSCLTYFNIHLPVTDELCRYLSAMPLETLIIHDASMITELGFTFFTHLHSSIRVLSLNGIRGISEKGVQVLKSLTLLKTLVVMGDWIGLSTIAALQSTGIEQLELSGQGFICPKQFHRGYSLPSSASPLPSQVTSRPPALPFEDKVPSFPKILPLRVLSLHNVAISDQGLHFILSTNGLQLESLSFEGCPYLTLQGLKLVLRSVVSLKWLRILRCDRIDSDGLLRWCKTRKSSLNVEICCRSREKRRRLASA